MATLLAAGGLVAAPLTVSAATTVYQAETGVITQGVVESNHAGYTGTGFVNGDNVVGSGLQLTVNVGTAGSTSIDVRYSN
ncbi:chemotaxis protein, partial [Kibdelosporangium lantanae]